jgi:LysM repeat protein
LAISKSQFIVRKEEGVVMKIVNSPLRLTVFAIILAIALTACVRPLQDEEAATATPDSAQAVPTTAPEQPPVTEPEGGEETAPPTEGEGAAEGEAESGTGEEGTPPTEGETETPTEGEAGTEQPAPEGESPQPPPTTATGEQIHVVQRGENLFRIGLRYGIPYQTLAAYNGIPNPHLIYEGQVIRIPPSG